MIVEKADGNENFWLKGIEFDLVLLECLLDLFKLKENSFVTSSQLSQLLDIDLIENI